MYRTIKTERYGIAPNPNSEGGNVKLEIRRWGRGWGLGPVGGKLEFMEAFGEVIANIGLIGEDLDRTVGKP
jgi:hypothetical protein